MSQCLESWKIMSKKGKSFAELLNEQKLDLDVLNWLEIVNNFEEFFKSEEFLTGYDKWKEEDDE